MTAPKRIQRRRVRGWRMPESAVYVGRGTRWGNPFVVGQTVVPPVESYEPRAVYVRDREHAVKLYRRWITGSANRCADLVPLLGGKDLACWCPVVDDQGNPVPCHADVLLELARRD